MPLRPGDFVQFIGPGPLPTPESFARTDPSGEPRPGDYGEVLGSGDGMARVAWRFGATTDTPVSHLSKEPERRKTHRYRVTYEGSGPQDVVYTVITGGGEAKAVHIATRALLNEHPDYEVWAIEVEDQGTDFVGDPEVDLLAFDEVS
jgi:hypothetical protein